MPKTLVLLKPFTFDNGKGPITLKSIDYDLEKLLGADVMKARLEARAYAGTDDEIAITAAIFARSASMTIDSIMQLPLIDFNSAGKIVADFLTVSPSTSESSG